MTLAQWSALCTADDFGEAWAGGRYSIHDDTAPLASRVTIHLERTRREIATREAAVAGGYVGDVEFTDPETMHTALPRAQFALEQGLDQIRRVGNCREQDARPRTHPLPAQEAARAEPAGKDSDSDGDDGGTGAAAWLNQAVRYAAGISSEDLRERVRGLAARACAQAVAHGIDVRECMKLLRSLSNDPDMTPDSVREALRCAGQGPECRLPALPEGPCSHPALRMVLDHPEALGMAAILECVETFDAIDRHIDSVMPAEAEKLRDWLGAQMPRVHGCLAELAAARTRLDCAQLALLKCACRQLPLVEKRFRPDFVGVLLAAGSHAGPSDRYSVCCCLIGAIAAEPCSDTRSRIAAAVLHRLLELADDSLPSDSVLPFELYEAIARLDSDPNLKREVMDHAIAKTKAAGADVNLNPAAAFSLRLDPRGRNHFGEYSTPIYPPWLVSRRQVLKERFADCDPAARGMRELMVAALDSAPAKKRKAG
ncbi:MAG TPA: hypothetical protein VHA82_07680 [Ramlibacter sp.]|uniref:hypothetical protein n=1 Tax=Ramlibacter sp. TaxID=1917967 RepID=UPI002C3C3479|nr:hypothetical protein [Ramlibacter sp.]HVZ43676.1 hypothetical protein [Ramlibacter sp.]